jgi:predicted small lipoprotein YifL
MGCANLRLWLLASVLASTAACSTGGKGPVWWPPSTGLAPIERPRPALAMRVALTLPVESSEGAVGKERLLTDEPAVPDIAGRWIGVWSGFGVLTRRVSMARAEFTQAGRWGWGKIVLSDALAADVPAVVTYRGALGVPVVFDVFPARVVMKHEAGGNYLSAVFRIDGDRMLGALRGHDTLIVLSRER